MFEEVFYINRKSFLVYFDWEAPLQELTDEELGELFRAMFIYAKHGELIEFEHRSLKLVFGFIKSAIERDKTAYEEKCRKNAENGSKGGKKKAENARPVGANMDIKALLETVTTAE